MVKSILATVTFDDGKQISVTAPTLDDFRDLIREVENDTTLADLTSITRTCTPTKRSTVYSFPEEPKKERR